MAYTKPQSPCARCGEAYEEEGANILLIRCGAIQAGKSLVEIQRLKNPRGAVHMCTAGPLEGCPRGFKREKKEDQPPAPTGCEKARAMLEAALTYGQMKLKGETK